MLPILIVVAKAAAALLVIASLAGILGLCLKMKPMLKMYSACLTIAFVLAMTVAAESLLYLNQVDSDLENHVQTAMLEKYGYPEFQSLSSEIDSMQNEMKCCGYKDAQDWFQARYYVDTVPTIQAERGNRLVPSSCCKSLADCPETYIDTDMFQEGCKEHLNSLSRKVLMCIGVSSAGMSLIEALGILPALHILAQWQKMEELTDSHLGR